jgi:hypothetical protein
MLNIWTINHCPIVVIFLYYMERKTMSRAIIFAKFGQGKVMMVKGDFRRRGGDGCKGGDLQG